VAVNPARAAFGADLANVGEARRFVRRALIDLEIADLDFEASQVVSELATNSVIHAGTQFEVEISYEAGVLRIGVSDLSPRGPIAKSHSERATTGRGLHLVAAVSEDWGTEARPGGKTVWCTLRLGSPPGARSRAEENSGRARETNSGASPRRSRERGTSNLAGMGVAA